MRARRKQLRAMRLRAALATGDFRTLLRGSEVPPLPAVVVRLVRLCEDDASDAADVARTIALDPGLAAWMLRLANSAAFGFAVRIADVRRAVVVLGMRRVRDYSLGRAVIGNLRRIRDDLLDGERFWAENLLRGLLASEIARAILPGSEGEAFTGGLLQDMAVPVLLAACPEAYGAVTCGTSGPELAAAEMEAFGWSHAQAGAWMGRGWHFPDELVCAIGLHHEPREDLAGRSLTHTPAGVVALSGRICSPCDPRPGEVEALTAELIDAYGLGRDAIQGVLSAAEVRFREALDVFQLPRPEGTPLASAPESAD